MTTTTITYKNHAIVATIEDANALADEWRFDLAAQEYSRIDIEITPSRRPSRPGDDHWQVSVTAAKDLD